MLNPPLQLSNSAGNVAARKQCSSSSQSSPASSQEGLLLWCCIQRMLAYVGQAAENALSPKFLFDFGISNRIPLLLRINRVRLLVVSNSHRYDGNSNSNILYSIRCLTGSQYKVFNIGFAVIYTRFYYSASCSILYFL